MKLNIYCTQHICFSENIHDSKPWFLVYLLFCSAILGVFILVHKFEFVLHIGISVYLKNFGLTKIFNGFDFYLKM